MTGKSPQKQLLDRSLIQGPVEQMLIVARPGIEIPPGVERPIPVLEGPVFQQNVGSGRPEISPRLQNPKRLQQHMPDAFIRQMRKRMAGVDQFRAVVSNRERLPPQQVHIDESRIGLQRIPPPRRPVHIRPVGMPEFPGCQVVEPSKAQAFLRIAPLVGRLVVGVAVLIHDNGGSRLGSFGWSRLGMLDGTPPLAHSLRRVDLAHQILRPHREAEPVWQQARLAADDPAGECLAVGL